METASVAIFGGLAVAAVVIALVIPLATAVAILAPVPLALVAARTRPRALLAVTVTATAVSFTMAGTGAAFSMLGSAAIGGLIGELKRRRLGVGSMLLVALVATPVLAGLSVLVLWILVPLRTLVLNAFGFTMEALGEWARRASLGGVGDAFDAFGDEVVTRWWLWLWVMGGVGTFFSILLAWWVLGKVLDRLAAIPSEDTLDARGAIGTQAAPKPLPLSLRGVGFSYTPTKPQVLHDITFDLNPGEFVAVVGANGSGKSTLAKILAGRPPTVGEASVPGGKRVAGLGEYRGTAMVLQRPEAQMLGSRVADDVVWGLPPEAHVDVDALLAEVGLDGLGARETSDLSGGQQQRLAIAAALARDPVLLIADEVTSMVDPGGRDELIEVLLSLPRRRGIAVVLITHRGAEAAVADRVIHLERGRMVAHAPDWEPRLSSPPSIPPMSRSTAASIGGPLLALREVAFTYLTGSPWEVRAVHDITLSVRRGDGLMVIGGNGSGKTTLAWLIAGLLTPDTGECLLGGKPTSSRIGDVALAFQHARLQLQKETVGDEIMAAGGAEVGSVEVARVLESVGLPRQLAATRIDALSGGQMRRVALAGLIARRPELMVLDEPLAGLDPGAREEIIALLAQLRAAGMTLIIISHDLESLGRICNRTVRISGGTLEPELGSAQQSYTGPGFASQPWVVPAHHDGGAR